MLTKTAIAVLLTVVASGASAQDRGFGDNWTGSSKNADVSRMRVIHDQITGRRPFPREHVSPGEAQLAASLGVDPADYTLSELAVMASDDGGGER